MAEFPRQELEKLLHSDAVQGLALAENLRSRLTRGEKPIIFGAGKLGRRVLQALKANGLNAVAFADNNAALWGTNIGEVPVLSPRDAVQQFGKDAAPIVSIFHPCLKSDVRRAVQQLQDLGCETTFTFPHLSWIFPSTLLPNFFWSTPQYLRSKAHELTKVFDLLADDQSRRAFLNALRLRLLADFEAADQPDTSAQYFSDFYRLTPSEYFVDCGAFDGDTVRDFVRVTQGSFRRIVAFEADPLNLQNLIRSIDELAIRDRTVVRGEAVAAHDGIVRFSAAGNSSAAVVADGEIEVPAVAIDTALAGAPITLLKMDIEGAEWDALAGARKSIAANRPVMAICVYHCADDLWRIPLYCHALMPDAKLYFRSYSADGFELVCYAVPPERQQG